MDREQLVEAMAEAINASSAAALPWAKLIDEAAQYPYSETWVRFCRDAARAALAVAEPVVREWERQEGRVRRSPAWQQVRDDQAAYEDQLRSVGAGDEIGRTGGTP